MLWCLFFRVDYGRIIFFVDGPVVTEDFCYSLYRDPTHIQLVVISLYDLSRFICYGQLRPKYRCFHSFLPLY